MMIFSQFSIDALLAKLSYIQNDLDPTLKLVLNRDWSSKEKDHRVLIRKSLDKTLTLFFSREQQALLYDLNWIPQASSGFISISHCRSVGGYAVSQKHKLGFDVEDFRRITVDVIKRTSGEKEFSECPRAEFLWVAKESGIKALSGTTGYEKPNVPLVATQLTAYDWKSQYENQVFSFRLKSSRTLEFNVNKGYVFLEGESLFSIYFA